MRTGPLTPDGQSGDTLSFCGLVHYPTRTQIGCSDAKEWQARFAAQPRASFPSGGATPAGQAATGSRRSAKRDNVERRKLFEGPRKTEQTEAHKTLLEKREELARVLERLRSPGLSPGVARAIWLVSPCKQEFCSVLDNSF